MLRVLSAALAAGMLLCPVDASAKDLFKATLSGDQEVPNPVATQALGTATLVLNDAQTRLEIVVQLSGVDLDGTVTPGTTADNVTGMHIHRAPPGTNGPVVFGFIGPNSDISGDLSITAGSGLVSSGWDEAEGNLTTLTAELPELFAGELYLNVHTIANPGGEIRGVILQADSVPGLPLPGLAALAALLLGASRRTLGRARAPARAERT